MKPSLQKIYKFLKLEAERGYDNRAVVGGMDKMLPTWEAEARADNLSEEFIQAVSARLRDYQRLSQASRAEALEGLWRRVQREANASLAPLPTPVKDKQETSFERPTLAKPKNQKEPEYQTPAIEPETPQPVLQEPEESQVNAKEEHPDLPDEKKEQAVPVLEAEPMSAPPRPSPPARNQARPQPIPQGPTAALGAPTTVLPGVGPRHAQTLQRLNLNTLGDMLYYFPRRYDDYSKLRPINRLFYGDEVTVIGTVQTVNLRPIRNQKLKIVEAVVSDGSGALRITWFNQAWQAQRLRSGMHIVLSGKIDQYLGRLVMNNPEWEPIEQQNLHTNRIVPVYPLTANITQRWLRKLMYQVVTYWAPRVLDPLPDWVRREAALLDLGVSIQQSHFPDSSDLLKAARQRLAFDEIFLLQLGVLRQKRAWQDRSARTFTPPAEWLESQEKRLPFALTGAQKRALQSLLSDLSNGRPMNRLLQGDVGSGKTVIAALGIAAVTREGAQAAMLAPTSILAEQHYQSMLKLLSGSENQDNESHAVLAPDQIVLLIGATPESEKHHIRQGLAEGTIKVVVGTHALLEDPVSFQDLQFVIIDEQHRFGVEQRALLRAKGNNPHLLVMTATPIPRSLALTIYGDLDLSVMDEMPPGRQAIDTHVLFPRERERAYTLIHNQLEQGRQAFIIYPLVEESETTDALAAVEESQRLQNEIFPHHRLGLLHGRLKPDEKEDVMRRFRDREIDILVSTSVVEVGVDIPNATVMVIEGANRFGLAQLHQFRGRVGRGLEKAYCLLIPDSPDDVENERLSAMAETNDGFILAERDLDQRGPGEFLGTRQSGYSELRLASLTDVHLIEKARRHAQALFELDPDLQQPEYQLLAGVLHNFWKNGGQDQPEPGTAGRGDIS